MLHPWDLYPVMPAVSIMRTLLRFCPICNPFRSSMAKILNAGIVYETDENGDYVLDADGNPIVKDASGYKAIIQKFNILKEYFANTWGMDITKLREVILRRTAEVKAMDLETLK